jgi:hypothetical protein
MKRVLGSAILLLLCSSLFAQHPPLEQYKQAYTVTAVRTKEHMTVDGDLKEPAWQQAQPATTFWQHWPVDKAPAARQTEVRMVFDENFLYISAICHDSTAANGNYIIQTLKRDQKFWDSDGFAVVLDPMSQATNGFVFGVSPYNVQSEGLNSSGMTSWDWDNKWSSATQRLHDRWTVEMAIPFKTLRYDSDHTSWAVNFIRCDLKANQYHTWTWIPQNFEGTDLAYLGRLRFSENLPAAKRNFSLIPYVTSSLKEARSNGEVAKGSANAGFDAKLALSSSMNLDLTVNPDFSQVEVDQQVTNLTRFNIFFPERRTFFLENDDLFSGYLYQEIRPFYSRRIGLDNEGNAIPILAGARLTGNVDNKTRIGLLNVQTEKKGDFAAQNYTAFSAHRRVLKRSLIKGYYLNRQSIQSPLQKQQAPMDAYGRNAGVELVYQNTSGSWMVWGGYHLSWKPTVKAANNSIENAGFQYNQRVRNTNYLFMIDYNGIGTNYHADMGFLARIENYDAVRDTTIRLGWKQVFTQPEISLFTKGKIQQHRFGLESFIVYNPDNSLNESLTRLRYFMEFQNTASLRFRWDFRDVRLLFPTAFTDAVPLPKAKYVFQQYNAEYTSDNRKMFVYSASVRAGGFYNGDYQQYSASVAYRKQPWGNFSVMVEKNDIRFPEPYGKANLFLIAPRVKINFSNNLYWTTFLQYNTQRNNFNINSRLQWRYKPMSDVFLVYTDNYFSEPFFKNKNRALVFKANYWLNL